MPDRYFIVFCILMAILPNIILSMWIYMAKHSNDRHEITVGTANEQCKHTIIHTTYVFVMLLPFYLGNIGTIREMIAMFVALLFVTFIIWQFNLYYMNPVIGALGYQVFAVPSQDDENPITGKMQYVVITRRVNIAPNEKIVASRLSNIVYLENHA